MTTKTCSLLAYLAASLLINWCSHALYGEPPQWENLSARIYEQLPEYEDIEPRLYRKVGGLVVLPDTGEVFVIMNRNFGVLRSTDQGETWTRIAHAPVQGRLYGGFSISLDAATGRFAIFTAETHRYQIEPVGGITHDRGNTWEPIPRPATRGRHDGFTWGDVDWTSDRPRLLLGKEHHAYISMWVSSDVGATWRRLPLGSRNVGVIDEQTFVAGVDHFATERIKDLQAGIYRSTDQGAHWAKVSDVVVNGKTPSHWGHRHVWTYPGGVLVSEDRGATWQRLGQELPGALHGPFFGRHADEMMVVTGTAIHITQDAGRHWHEIAPAPGAGSVNHPTVSYGWDPARRLIYYAPVGGDVFRMHYTVD